MTPSAALDRPQRGRSSSSEWAPFFPGADGVSPSHDRDAPHNRRRHGRVRGRVAGGRDGRARDAARDAPRRGDLRAPDWLAGRDGLLQFLPLRRRRAERRRPAPLGDARGGRAGDGDGRRAFPARGRCSGGGPRPVRGRRHGTDTGASAGRDRSGRDHVAARDRPLDRRHRPAHRLGAGAGHRGRRPDRTRSPSSTPSPPSSTPTAST